MVLFTRSLARVMGYKGQFALYGYYVAVAWLLRAISPPLAQMAASEAALSGGYRAAHQRLAAAAEEVAFNDPPAGAAERLVLDQHLRRLVRFGALSSLQRFLQQIADGYFVKYFASCVALLVYAAPIYAADPAARGDQARLTGDYIRSMRLLQNTSRAVGDLILVYKRVSGLASHTARVSELLEQVTALSAEDAEHRELFRRNVGHSLAGAAEEEEAEGGTDGGGKEGGGEEEEVGTPPPPAARTVSADGAIRFSRVSLDAPDGTPLVRDLTFEVARGASVMLMGPNGCGKSSLFRVMAGLWPLQAGEVALPADGRVFYLSQRPYLVAGTLRDQLLYPHPPAAVWGATPAAARAQYAAAGGGAPPRITPELDAGKRPRWGLAVCERMGREDTKRAIHTSHHHHSPLSLCHATPNNTTELAACLDAVDLGYLLQRGRGWDAVQEWQATLSGGEKQRLALARLLFHRPAFAVLDECTSAVSADGEVRLYEACARAGVTLLSIAHRPALKRFHRAVVHFEPGHAGPGGGGGGGRGWW